MSKVSLLMQIPGILLDMGWNQSDLKNIWLCAALKISTSYNPRHVLHVWSFLHMYIFRYHGEKLNRNPGRAERQVVISTIYDDPNQTDPTEPLNRRHDHYRLKYRDVVKFDKTETINFSKSANTGHSDSSTNLSGVMNWLLQ